MKIKLYRIVTFEYDVTPSPFARHFVQSQALGLLLFPWKPNAAFFLQTVTWNVFYHVQIKLQQQESEARAARLKEEEEERLRQQELMRQKQEEEEQRRQQEEAEKKIREQEELLKVRDR